MPLSVPQFAAGKRGVLRAGTSRGFPGAWLLLACAASWQPALAAEPLPAPTTAAAADSSAHAPSAADSAPRYVLDPIPVSAAAWRDDPMLTKSVLGRSELASPGVLRLADALGSVPGLRVLRTGAPGSYAALSIRGSSSEQVLVLVDGRRLSAAQGGGVDLGAVDVATLERVEIVRGAASALYGSDAVGGVVNLVTRPEAVAQGTSLRFEGGSHGVLAAALRHERPAFGRGLAWLRLHGLQSDGDYSYEGARGEDVRENADVASDGLGLGLALGAPEGRRLTGDLAFEETAEGVPGPSEFPTPEARRDDRVMTASSELRLPLASGAQLRAGVAADRRRRSYVDPASDIADRHVNRSAAVTFGLESTGLGWSGGAELRHAELESTTDGDRTRQSAGLYARDAFGWSTLTLAPAARLDVTSDAEPLWGLRLAAGLGLPGRRTLKIAGGNAYRLPSFDDLFAADRGASIGNPALRPERALEGELGLHTPLVWPSLLLAGEGALTVTGYARRIEDLIQWTPGPDGRWRPHNVGLAVVRGLELELMAPLPAPGLAQPASLTVAFTALDARDQSGEPAVDGRRLPYRPALSGQVELGLELPLALGFRARWQATGESYTTAANTKRLPGYALLDLTCERALGRRMIGSVAVLNALDVDAVDVRDYPLPGREWRLGMRVGSAPTKD